MVTSGAYLRASRAAGAGRVVQPGCVVGEVRHLDHARPRAGGEARYDVVGVLGVFVVVGVVDRVGDRGDKVCYAGAELVS